MKQVAIDGKAVAIIGGGPAGLIAAEQLASAGVSVTVYERNPSLGRKFLMAGRGGLNLTHSEDLPAFLARYGTTTEKLRTAVETFTPQNLRDWSAELGEETFVGSSGRVFPKSFKASPLLRAWQQRLQKLGVAFRFQHNWKGWRGNDLIFTNAHGEEIIEHPDAVLLALGGGSWPRLGSDGGWVPLLRAQNIAVNELTPSNCGFHVAWSDIFKTKFSGQPLKPVALTFGERTIKGEIMIDSKGIEGGAVYALSADLRDALPATLYLDLAPDVPMETLTKKLAAPRQTKSFSNFLRTATGLSPVAANILREAEKNIPDLPPRDLAQLVKKMPLTVTETFGIERAISSGGGIPFDVIDDAYMLTQKPGVFVAGEMIDWEAPTGGYLLQACFSTGVAAAKGILNFLK